MAILTRGQAEIYYEVHGSGPTILLTHGFSSTSHMWRGQIEPFAKDHTLILWDMRGHGKTEVPDNLDLFSEEEEFLDDAKRKLEDDAETAAASSPVVTDIMTRYARLLEVVAPLP